MIIAEKRYYQQCLGCQGPNSNNFNGTCPTCLKLFLDDMTDWVYTKKEGDDLITMPSYMTTEIKEKINDIITNYENNSKRDKEEYTRRARELWENMVVTTRQAYETEVAQLMQQIKLYNEEVGDGVHESSETSETEDETKDSDDLFIDQRGG